MFLYAIVFAMLTQGRALHETWPDGVPDAGGFPLRVSNLEHDPEVLQLGPVSDAGEPSPFLAYLVGRGVCPAVGEPCTISIDLEFFLDSERPDSSKQLVLHHRISGPTGSFQGFGYLDIRSGEPVNRVWVLDGENWRVPEGEDAMNELRTVRYLYTRVIRQMSQQ